MEVRSFSAELAIANLQFKRIFSNIVIDRRDAQGNTKQIPVTCVLGQRSRIVKNWENSAKRSQISLPLIAINRTGYARNGERLNNLHNEVKYEMTSSKRSYDLLTPVPVDISYEVSIVSKYQSDIDQIASNFMVFFNNAVYVRCMHPKYEGLTINNQIVIDDNVSEEHPDELDASADDLVTSTFTFTFKTYLFGGSQKAKKVPSKILSSYLSTFTSSYVIEIPRDELDQFLKDNPYASLSSTVSERVTSTLTALVDNPDASESYYDGIVPIVEQICVGYYPVPESVKTESDYRQYMSEVDGYPLSDQQFYVDRLRWTIDELSDSSSTI